MTAQWAPLVMAGALVPWCFGHHGEASDRVADFSHILEPTRCSREPSTCGANLHCYASVDSRLATADHGVPALFPILLWPGPLLVLALWKYRDRDARFLFLSALMPQRWFYDSLTLWLIPKSRREIVWTVFLSSGTRSVALVSHTAYFFRSRAMDRRFYVLASSRSCATATSSVRR